MYYGEFDPHMTRLFAEADDNDTATTGLCEEPEVTADDVRFALLAGAVVLLILGAILAVTAA